MVRESDSDSRKSCMRQATNTVSSRATYAPSGHLGRLTPLEATTCADAS